jgi:hypothetical protein
MMCDSIRRHLSGLEQVRGSAAEPMLVTFTWSPEPVPQMEEGESGMEEWGEMREEIKEIRKREK